MRTRRVLGLLISMVLVASLAWGCSSDKGETKVDSKVSDQAKDNADNNKADVNKTDDAVQDKNDAKADAGKTDDVKTDAPKTDDKKDDSKSGDTAVANSNVKGSLTVESDIKDGCVYENGVYKITKGGIYTFKGEIENGQIYVEVSDDEEVEIALAGVTMSNDSDSCIYIENAGDATISAKKDTLNTLTDNRARKVSDEDKTGSGCIYSKDDLKISGKGELDVIANYNNGIACKNDIKIKNLTLKVSAPGNAIKGNDSITIESGEITVVSTEGDGLKTKNTDISPKGKQRGWIKIKGGIVNIYAADDCIKAAFDFKIDAEATVTEKRYK